MSVSISTQFLLFPIWMVVDVDDSFLPVEHVRPRSANGTPFVPCCSIHLCQRVLSDGMVKSNLLLMVNSSCLASSSTAEKLLGNCTNVWPYSSSSLLSSGSHLCLLMGCRRWLGDSIPLSAPTLTWLGWGPCSSVRNSALVTRCLCQSSNCQCLGLLMLFKSCPCCPTGAWNTCFVCSHVCCSLLSNLVEVAVDCVWIFFVECWPQSNASAIRFLFVISWSWIHHCSNFSLNSQPLNSPWISNLWIHYPCHE